MSSASLKLIIIFFCVSEEIFKTNIKIRNFFKSNIDFFTFLVDIDLTVRKFA